MMRLLKYVAFPFVFMYYKLEEGFLAALFNLEVRILITTCFISAGALGILSFLGYMLIPFSVLDAAFKNELGMFRFYDFNLFFSIGGILLAILLYGFFIVLIAIIYLPKVVPLFKKNIDRTKTRLGL